jgi:hypothetical protein
VLGLFPKGWRVPMSYRRDNERKVVLVRLMGVQRGILEDRPSNPGRPAPGGPRPPVPAGPPSPAAKFFKAKEGFANYYFNEEAQNRVLTNFGKFGDFSKLTGDWTLKLGGKLLAGLGAKDFTGSVTIRERGATDGKSPKVEADIDGLPYELEPLKSDEKSEAFKDPPESGGFLIATFLYRQFLVYGIKGFTSKDGFFHGGVEPYYPPTDDEKPDYLRIRVLAEVLRTKFAGMESRWFFATEDDTQGRWKKGQLIGFEVTPDKDEDPCEVCLSHYKDFGGRQMPSKMLVRKGEKNYGDFTLTGVTLK